METRGTGGEIICTLFCSVLCCLLLLLQTGDQEGILCHLSFVFLLNVGKEVLRSQSSMFKHSVSVCALETYFKQAVVNIDQLSEF